MSADFLIIGVGASAGGLEALERFFEAIPDDLDAAFIVVQHLSPDHKSLMWELLSKHTRMPVHEATDGELLAPRTVLTMPPRSNLEVDKGRLKLKERSTQNLNLPINQLFGSLAENFGERAVAVVLSGTGSDGRLGLEQVKQAGGMAFVQEPGTARFDGMPLAAISTGLVDGVLPPEGMGPELLRAHHNGLSPQQLPAGDEEALRRIQQRLQAVCGIDFGEYKRATVLRRLAWRMNQLSLSELSEYARRVELEAAEVETLSRELLINVTQFFRDEDAFTALALKALPALVKRGETHPLRLWVAGCSTGQEAYSLAMLLSEQLPRSQFKIFATDVDLQALEVASQGVYSETDIAEVSPERRARFFKQRGSTWEVDRELRRRIVFAPHNIARDPPFTRIDLLSCRNVLIYMSPALQRRVLGTFAFALRTGGVLLLGSSETLGEVASRFEPLESRQKLFTRLDVPQALPERPGLASPRAPAAAPSDLQQATEAATRLLLDRVAPAAVLTNERLEVLRVFGNAERLLALQTGAATLSLVAMLPAALQTITHLAAQRALSTGRDVVLAAPEAQSFAVGAVHVQCFVAGRANERYLVVTFERPQGGHDDARPLSEEAAHHLADLERELVVVRESLQATVEEVESSNEELQTTNEELLASNEELQSTNEELQSVNEELTTVNSEHQEKILELTRTNEDLDNLFDATTVGMVFLDEELKIRRFSALATQQLSLLARDVGRPVEHITHQFVDLNLTQELKRVLTTQEVAEREATTLDGRHALLKLSPFRASNREVRGVLATFIDVTPLRSEQRARAQLQQVLDALTEEVAVVGLDGVIQSVNEAWLDFGRRNAGTPQRLGAGANYLDACRSAPEIHAALLEVLSGRRARYSVEYPCHTPTEQRWFLMGVGRLADGSAIVVSHTDITSRHPGQP
jgi:two-component system CheB/CheR fusion protein